MNHLQQAWQYVQKWSIERPNSEALIDGNARITWAEFNRQVDATARAFLALGVEPGDRVAMLAMARPEFMTSYMAAGKIGAMWLGLNPKFSLDELRYQLGDSKPKVLITLRHFLDNDLGDTIRTLMSELPFLEKVLVLGEPIEGTERYQDAVDRGRASTSEALTDRVAAVSTGANDPLLMYTSGSTGKPKGVVQSHASIVSNISVMVDKLHFSPDDRMIVHFPINHVASDVEIGLSCLFAGGTLVFMDRFDPVASLQMVAKEKITILGQVPVMYLMQMQTPVWKTDWYKTVRAFVVSGAIPPAPLIGALKQIQHETGCIVYNAYGSTEACGLVTYTADDDPLDFIAESVGKVPAPMRGQLVDNDMKQVATGEVGELVLQGPFLFKEYLGKPEATAAAFTDKWYHTGDLARADGAGNLFITGRKSEMFKTGGENVFPREVEQVIEGHPAVMFAAVLGVPDELYQEVGWAFVMVKPGQQVTEEALQEACKSRLANFKVPKRFFVRPVLPLLATGKVDKVSLRREIEAMTDTKK